MKGQEYEREYGEDSSIGAFFIVLVGMVVIGAIVIVLSGVVSGEITYDIPVKFVTL